MSCEIVKQELASASQQLVNVALCFSVGFIRFSLFKIQLYATETIFYLFLSVCVISSLVCPNRSRFSEIFVSMEMSMTKKSTFNRKSRRKAWLCLGWIFGFLLLIVVLIVILAATVFKPKHPVTTINSVDLKGLKVSLGPALRVDLNLTLIMDISVTNPNKAGFKYGNSSAFIYYRGEVVGQATIPPGNISPEGTAEMNTTVTILADRLLYDSNFYSDVFSGTLPLSTYSRISGRVTILHLFKHHLVSYTSCNVTVSISSRTVDDSQCKYRTQL